MVIRDPTLIDKSDNDTGQEITPQLTSFLRITDARIFDLDYVGIPSSYGTLFRT